MSRSAAQNAPGEAWMASVGCVDTAQFLGAGIDMHQTLCGQGNIDQRVGG